MPAKKVFISYSRDDRKLVERIVESLRKENIDVWFDYHLLSGQDWDDALESQILECDHMILVLSKTSVASDNVKNEMRFAMDHGKPINPIYIEQCSVPLSMRRMHYIDFVKMGFEDGIKRLIKDINHIEGNDQIEKEKAIHINQPKSKKTLWMSIAGILVIGVLIWQFWPSSVGNTSQNSVLNSPGWDSVQKSDNLYDKVNYIAAFQDTEGQLRNALTSIGNELTDEGAIMMNRSTFSKLFFKLVYQENEDTIVNVTRNFNLPFPKRGDVLIAQKQTSVMKPDVNNPDNMGGTFLMPGDVIQFEELLDASGEQMFVKFSFNKGVHSNGNELPEATKVRPNMTVIGFHPYWNNGKEPNYRYNLLTDLAYASLELEPTTGDFIDLNGLDTSKAIEISKQAENNILIHINIYGEANQTSFLNNAMAQDNAIKKIDGILSRVGGQGIILDFTDLKESNRLSFANFVKNLSSRLKQYKYSVSITLPFSMSASYDIIELKDFVNYFIMMAGFSDQEYQTNAMPLVSVNSNNKWNSAVLSESIGSYLEAGIPKDKFLVNLCYYGGLWETNDETIPSEGKFWEFVSYEEIKKKYGSITTNYDPESQSAYKIIKEGDRYLQLWFDDENSLSHKYDVVKSFDLGGVAIWALGFDSKTTELWDLMAEKVLTKSE